MLESDEVLTVRDVAQDLRCSKAHVHKLIRGAVYGVSSLPAIHMGRRWVVLRSSLEMWKRANERATTGDIVHLSPEVDAAGRMKGNGHA